jgi:hypothetical protein
LWWKDKTSLWVDRIHGPEIGNDDERIFVVGWVILRKWDQKHWGLVSLARKLQRMKKWIVVVAVVVGEAEEDDVEGRKILLLVTDNLFQPRFQEEVQ